MSVAATGPYFVHYYPPIRLCTGSISLSVALGEDENERKMKLNEINVIVLKAISTFISTTEPHVLPGDPPKQVIRYIVDNIDNYSAAKQKVEQILKSSNLDFYASPYYSYI